LNKIESETQVTRIIQSDDWMMSVLRAAEDLNLPDWWIGAGFLRNKVWDYIEGGERHHSRDIDLVYFDKVNTSSAVDYEYDTLMNKRHFLGEWEIRNQARMHKVGGFEPFSSTADGIAHWPETATAIAVKLEKGKLTYLFCYGTEDLFGLIVGPTEHFDNPEGIQIFRSRVEKKHWADNWEHLKIING